VLGAAHQQNYFFRPSVQFRTTRAYNALVQQKKTNSELHWGPKTQNAFPVKGTIGLIITIGVMFIVLAGVPAARLWFFVSIPAGILLALLFHFLRR
jgi:hypothetical protein